MEFSQDQSWDKLGDILQRDLPLSEAWAEFIDFHSGVRDKPFWNDMRNVDLKKGQEEIAEWLNGLPADEPLPDSLAALWFGIVTMRDQLTGTQFYAYYLLGADDYDADGMDWGLEPSYSPSNRHYVGETINLLRSYIIDDEDFDFLGWIFPLACTTFLLNGVFESHLDKSQYLASREQLHAAVGYENGDFVHLKTISK